MIQVLQNEIATQQNILADLTEEAAGIGIDPADLAALSSLAVTLAADAPIDLQPFVPEWVLDDAIGGFFTGTGHGLAMIGNAATFHMIDPLDNYVDNVIAQNGGAYGTANVFAHVGAYVAEAAGVVWIYQVFINPATLYHFTSASAAESIAASGTINMGSGLFGSGVYASSINSAFVATLMGARSTEAVIVITASTVTKYPTLIPGAWRIIHDVVVR